MTETPKPAGGSPSLPTGCVHQPEDENFRRKQEIVAKINQKANAVFGTNYETPALCLTETAGTAAYVTKGDYFLMNTELLAVLDDALFSGVIAHENGHRQDEKKHPGEDAVRREIAKGIYTQAACSEEEQLTASAKIRKAVSKGDNILQALGKTEAELGALGKDGAFTPACAVELKHIMLKAEKVSHQAEFDADAVAVQLGYGNEFQDFLELSRRVVGDKDPQIITSHPSDGERIERMDAVLAKKPEGGRVR